MAEYQSLLASATITRARLNGHLNPEAAIRGFISEASRVVKPGVGAMIHDFGWQENDFTVKVLDWIAWRFCLATWIAFWLEATSLNSNPRDHEATPTLSQSSKTYRCPRLNALSVRNVTRLTIEDLKRVELQDKETGEWVLFEDWEKRNNERQEQQFEKVYLQGFYEGVKSMSAISQGVTLAQGISGVNIPSL
ncbi:uncharacterized protein PAC_13539 [Phialocephala subalpina]|uniref:Uncharacterized protein n=1 Tax=Phialocephala subalpina TaxID=576137 RepID=A0A1L7XF34_9HELO|nr:uncharacterized protein PAC_13539 [Phialocephala subalpina]